MIYVVVLYNKYIVYYAIRFINAFLVTSFIRHERSERTTEDEPQFFDVLSKAFVSVQIPFSKTQCPEGI
jgi:hypothetical protein